VGRGSLVSPRLREAVRSGLEPLARALARVGLTADRLTVAGFAVAAIGGLLAALGAWLPAGVVAIAGAAFDLLDGAVARATGTSSRLGAFMDSTFDRWGEGLVHLGIVIGCTAAGFEVGAWLATAGLVAAFMVSYTRARGEALGFSPGTGLAAVGLAPREVRVVILAAGLIGAGLVGGVGPGGDGTGEAVLGTSLALITLLASVTVVQRIRYVRSQAHRAPDTEEPG
jgi:phosphatidylglycerophosphate synthase